MDNWNAPQWADFNASLMSDIDEYFNTEHKELETTTFSTGTVNDSSNSSYNTPRSNGFASPLISGNSRGSSIRLNKTSDSLSSAMSALQIKSAKKSLLKQSLTPSALRVKRVLANSPLTTSVMEYNENTETDCGKTEIAKIDQVTEEKTDAVADTQEQQQEPVARGDNVEVENVDNNATLVASSDEEDQSTPKAVETIETVPAEKLQEPEIDEEPVCIIEPAKMSNPEASEVQSKPEDPNEEKLKLAKLESRLEPSNRTFLNKKLFRARSDKPRVLTSQVRRHSTAKYRRGSAKFVSLAEAISRFQNGTPQRFRSANHKNYIPAPVQKVKQTAMKLTCPMSPALRCKKRTRAASAPTQEPKTGIKTTSNPKPKPLKKMMHSASVPARTLPERSSSITKPLRKIEKIPPIPPVQQKTTMPPPKAPTVLKKIEKILGDSIRGKDTSMMSTSMMSESIRNNKHTPCKKTVPSVVSTDEGVALKDVEILHFGIPVGGDCKKITRTIPFSFEARNKELQSKKEKEKLKNMKVEEEKMKKTFHARPAPSFTVAKKTTSVLKPKENNTNKDNHITRNTLSFQERNEMALKKKKELMDQIAEQEKKARIFHAKPAPNFKPVFVRGNSTENLRSGCDGNKSRTRGISPSARQRGLSQESIASSNQENKAPPAANQQCPKLKNPLITQNLKLKKAAK